MKIRDEVKQLPGLVHIYTGNGKGKTTAAVGQGIRACGRGMKVLMVQFLKGSTTGELFTIQKLLPDFEIFRHKKIGKFTCNMTHEQREEMKKNIENLFQYVVQEAMSGRRDLVILDEIMAAISSGLIATDTVLSFVKSKPSELELIMTGRNAPLEIIQLADYVSEIKSVKHPLEAGIPAREGIEY